jgi:hypothetical protein
MGTWASLAGPPTSRMHRSEGPSAIEPTFDD